MTRPVPVVPAVALLACANFVLACGVGTESPKRGITVLFAAPPPPHSPLADPALALVTMAAEWPGQDLDKAPHVTMPYAAGELVELGPPHDDVPHGAGRQVRIELHAAGGSAGSTQTLIAVGRTVPVDSVPGDEPLERRAYVTRAGAIAPIWSVDGKLAALDQRIGAAAALTSDHKVVFVGGARTHQKSMNPLDITAFDDFDRKAAVWDIDTGRVGQVVDTQYGDEAILSEERAFAVAAVGASGVVAVIGGYVSGPSGPEATKLVEFLDPESGRFVISSASEPHLARARAHHGATPILPPSDFVLVTGGKGAAQFPVSTWELWHPKLGRVDTGELSKPRWNHSVVHIPGKDGGAVILVGGENGQGPLADLEIIRYDNTGNFSFKGNGKLTCRLKGKVHDEPNSTSICKGLRGREGYVETRWVPEVRPYPLGRKARKAPGVALLERHGATHLLMVGGFGVDSGQSPTGEILVYDVSADTWVADQPQLKVARGAPLVAVGRSVDGTQRMLVTGGIGVSGKVVDASEEIHFGSKLTGQLVHRVLPGKTPGGGRVMASAIALPTGMVLLSGGLTSKGGTLVPATELTLWNP